MNENWEPITDYENYLISDKGRVYNCVSEKYLRPWDNCDGYLVTHLCKGTKGKYFRIHRLIAKAFIPNPDNKPQIDHINRNRKDNRLCNLRWVFPCENNQNCSISSRNSSGIQNISFDKTNKVWEYSRNINHKTHKKRFKTKEEANAYKEGYEDNLRNQGIIL